MKTLILGIDDAGRGPVIGPMVLAGCLIDQKIEPKLKELGVKDSKKVAAKKRDLLAQEIKNRSETFEIVLAPPIEIDESNHNGTKLNELEAIKIAEIINKINKGYAKIKVIVDCPSPSIEKWQNFLITKIKNISNLEISCEHKADSNHISVAAASILAKHIRETEMDKLKKIYGQEIGSGYTSDTSTIKFLAKHAAKHENKGIFRKTWITWKKAYEKLGQKTLS